MEFGEIFTLFALRVTSRPRKVAFSHLWKPLFERFQNPVGRERRQSERLKMKNPKNTNTSQPPPFTLQNTRSREVMSRPKTKETKRVTDLMIRKREQKGKKEGKEN